MHGLTLHQNRSQKKWVRNLTILRYFLVPLYAKLFHHSIWAWRRYVATNVRAIFDCLCRQVFGVNNFAIPSTQNGIVLEESSSDSDGTRVRMVWDLGCWFLTWSHYRWAKIVHLSVCHPLILKGGKEPKSTDTTKFLSKPIENQSSVVL
jgi:hypothetical protein